MEVAVARYAGFCPGVRRAVRMVEETLERSSTPVYSLGPVIHNPQVVAELEERGLRILPEEEGAWEETNLDGARVVVRSHGVPPDQQEKLLSLGATLVDATCPTVKKAQRAAMRLVGEGYKLFVIGNAEHPEVKAILGNVRGEAVVIKEIQELKDWWVAWPRKVRKVGLIAQTTVDLMMFRSLVDGLINEVPELIREVMELKIINTLCRNTLSRQAEAMQLALGNDLVVVVGGRNSSNTEFLRRICEMAGTKAVKVETADELDPSVTEGARSAAVLGGASTPLRIVEEVRDWLASA
ncbi:MAG: 4-hydroxy-3-methylbut-2-enyl diphosphate reductase [Actinobacteria bacterium]|nr:4-hydroxy-3-methylbut-2-enyl diphosphate reductase [Actinomycetota bacterium]